MLGPLGPPTGSSPALAPPRRKRRAAPSKKKRSAARAVDGDLQGTRVLVVEDDPMSARVLLAELDLRGCDLRVAHSAEEALAILQLFPAQALVVDLVLPGMSGLLLARLVTTDPTHRNAVVVAVSFLHGAGTERLAIESGCAAYLQKPIDADNLARIISHHLQARSRNA